MEKMLSSQTLLVEKLKRDIRNCLIEPIQEDRSSLPSSGGCKHIRFEIVPAECQAAGGDLKKKAAHECQSSDLSFEVLKVIIDAAFTHITTPQSHGV